jgi:phosphoenolpyruvate synthase/pyruvate phosphate dikinase
MERRVFDERDEAVKRLIKQTIEVCNEMGKYVGICGQAPSDYPEFAGTTSSLHHPCVFHPPTHQRSLRTAYRLPGGVRHSEHVPQPG